MSQRFFVTSLASLLLCATLAVPAVYAANIDAVHMATKVAEGNACPRAAVIMLWARMDGPGIARFVIEGADGVKTGQLPAKAVKGAAGVWLATYAHEITIQTDVNTKYRAHVVGTANTSDWVPLTAACASRARTSLSAPKERGGGNPRAQDEKARP